MKLTTEQVQRDLDALGQYRTGDVDKLIRNYVKQKADVTALREHVLLRQQFHRIYYYVALKQRKSVEERMAFIHENLLFSDWWHTDQLICFVADLDFETALTSAKEYIRSEDPFIRRWGYVLFISRLGRGHAEELLPLMKNDEQYYVQMAQAWLIAELAVTQPEAVYDWLSECNLRYNICGKAIQKICDSFRISREWKTRFKGLRCKLRDNPSESQPGREGLPIVVDSAAFGETGSMKQERIDIQGIPAIIWGEPSEKVYLHVHGKMSSKESAEGLASIAGKAGFQTVSFDLPQHGDRKDGADRCDIWNGIRDLAAVAEYVFARWKHVHLYACSLGAFFSLHAYRNYPFQKALFQSPIVDMEYLIGQMMLWFGISEERLEGEREIDTPIDVLSWRYYQYVKANPVSDWNIPTWVLYGGKDDLQSRQVMEEFCRRFDCRLTVAEESMHPFMEKKDIPIVENWLVNAIQEEAV